MIGTVGLNVSRLLGAYILYKTLETAALNRDIFLLAVLMGIILPRQVHSYAS